MKKNFKYALIAFIFVLFLFFLMRRKGGEIYYHVEMFENKVRGTICEYTWKRERKLVCFFLKRKVFELEKCKSYAGKKIKDILWDLNVNLEDASVILLGDSRWKVAGLKVESRQKDKTYYLYFDLSDEDKVFCLRQEKKKTVEEVKSDLLNSVVVSQEVVGKDFYCLNGNFCVKNRNGELLGWEVFARVKYQPFVFYEMKSRVTGKRFRLDVDKATLSDLEKIGLSRFQIFKAKVVSLFFCKNPFSVYSYREDCQLINYHFTSVKEFLPL